jgi:hypothetical protein
LNDDKPSEEILDVMRSLRLAAPLMEDLQSGHLDDDVLAAIIEGVEPGTHRKAIAHLAKCSECRNRVAAVATLLDDPVVAAEIPHLGRSLQLTGARRWSPARWASVATLAAAALITIVVARPDKIAERASSPKAQLETRREGTITTTAPRILSASTLTSIQDSVRWTSVPHADLYSVRIWNSEGTVVWSAETRDTALALPGVIALGDASYLWEVKARTGWDRWVSSDFVELNVRVHSGAKSGIQP